MPASAAVQVLADDHHERSAYDRSATHNDPAILPLVLASGHIANWTIPGDLVLDSIAGSVRRLRAARDAGRRSIGIKIHEPYYQLAHQRVLQPELMYGLQTDNASGTIGVLQPAGGCTGGGVSSTSRSEGCAVLCAVTHGDLERETGMIFVDVDDTLVLYDTNADNHPHPCGVLRGEHFTIRHAIVNRLLARSWATVVLWSGGGVTTPTWR